jgi:hypothetical protein|tara:strand:+ start:605 stop:1102 length:498 start_codon:yes stop_codon:yes gene_type:complete
MRSEEDELRQFLWINRIPSPINVTLTEKQSAKGFKIDDINSDRNFRHFKNVLNTKLFGNGYRRFGKHIQMLVVRESCIAKRHHLHCIFEKPDRIASEEFCYLIKKMWRVTDYGYEQVHIEDPSCTDREDGWLGYILKKRTKVNLLDSIDWNNTSIQQPILSSTEA